MRILIRVISKIVGSETIGHLGGHLDGNPTVRDDCFDWSTWNTAADRLEMQVSLSLSLLSLSLFDSLSDSLSDSHSLSDSLTL